MSRSALIGGAGPGLGLATGRRLGQAGYDVSSGRTFRERLAELVAELTALGVVATAHVGDVTAHAALTNLVRQIDELTPVDVCVF